MASFARTDVFDARQKYEFLWKTLHLDNKALSTNLTQRGKKPATSERISTPPTLDPARAARCLNDAAVSLHCLDAQQTLRAHKRKAAWFSGAPSIANVAPQ